MIEKNKTNTLIMTAAITPQMGPKYEVNRRYNEYFNALSFYLKLPENIIKRIIFIENTGYDLSDLKKTILKENIHNKRVDYISYINKCDLHRGKGHSEFFMFDYLVNNYKNEKIINDNEYYWKVTGRLIFKNIEKLISSVPNEYNFYCDMRDVPYIKDSLGKNKWMDTRIFSFNPIGLKYILGESAKMTQPCIETHMFKVIKDNMRDDSLIIPRFKIQPYVIGYCGGSSKNYEGFEYIVKHHIRKISRFLFPNLWL